MRKPIQYKESQNRLSQQSKADLTPGEKAMQEAEYSNFRSAHYEDDYEGDGSFDYRNEDWVMFRSSLTDNISILKSQYAEIKSKYPSVTGISFDIYGVKHEDILQLESQPSKYPDGSISNLLSYEETGSDLNIWLHSSNSPISC